MKHVVDATEGAQSSQEGATAPSSISNASTQPKAETPLHGQENGVGVDASSRPALPIDEHVAEPVITAEQASIFLQAMYPACLAKTRRKILKRFRRKERRGRIGRVVGAVTDCWCRHQRTDYEALLQERRMSRNEARRQVAVTLKTIVEAFRQGSAETDAGYLQIKASFHAKRTLEGKIAVITAAENEAIVAYLRSWLQRRRSEQLASAEVSRTQGTASSPKPDDPGVGTDGGVDGANS